MFKYLMAVGLFIAFVMCMVGWFAFVKGDYAKAAACWANSTMLLVVIQLNAQGVLTNG